MRRFDSGQMAFSWRLRGDFASILHGLRAASRTGLRVAGATHSRTVRIARSWRSPPLSPTGSPCGRCPGGSVRL